MSREVVVLSKTDAFGHAIAQRLRERGCQVVVVRYPEEALQAIREAPVELMIGEVTMPADDERTRARIQSVRPSCRVLFVQSVDQLRESGRLLREVDGAYLLADQELAALTPPAAGAADRGSERTRALVKVLDLIVSLDESEDPHFAGFTNQVTRLSVTIARELGLDEASIEDINVACLLRDIGKAGIRSNVLTQPDTLSEGDVEHMQEHVNWSVRLLEHIDFDGKVLPTVRHHHERYDGTGYPDGLRGRQIPIGSRVIATAEAFAAMTSDRPHRRARSAEDALDELMARSGRQFDPEVVEALTKALRDTSVADLTGRRSILIVDPHRESRRLLRMKLLNEGYAVAAVESLSEESSPPLDDDPHLVVFDASDGGDEALAWLARMRQHVEHVPIPFAVMVPSEAGATKMRVLEHGVDDIIDKSGSLQEIGARIKNILIREAARAQRLSHRREVGITGHLRNFPVAEITQMLTMGQKTARISLRGPSRAAELRFREGLLVHAEAGSATGEGAFQDVLGWDDAEFIIQHGALSGEDTMNVDPMSLLLEHLHLVDEISSGIDSRMECGDPSAAAVNE